MNLLVIIKMCKIKIAKQMIITNLACLGYVRCIIYFEIVFALGWCMDLQSTNILYTTLDSPSTVAYAMLRISFSSSPPGCCGNCACWPRPSVMLSRLLEPSPGDVSGGGRSREGSSSDWFFVDCFLTGVRLGEDLRLFANVRIILALQMEWTV